MQMKLLKLQSWDYRSWMKNCLNQKSYSAISVGFILLKLQFFNCRKYSLSLFSNWTTVVHCMLSMTAQTAVKLQWENEHSGNLQFLQWKGLQCTWYEYSAKKDRPIITYAYFPNKSIQGYILYTELSNVFIIYLIDKVVPVM